MKRGRPREFSESEVLGSMMKLFWKQGYGPTSMSDLEKASGLPRVSLYNAFGDKKAIYASSLSFYFDFLENELFHDMKNDGGIREIHAFFDRFLTVDLEVSPLRWGCLVVNTSLECESISIEMNETIRGYRSSIKSIFIESLAKDINQKGKIRIGEIEEMAEFLVTVVWGLFVSIRLENNTEAIRPVVNHLHQTLDRWEKESTKKSRKS